MKIAPMKKFLYVLILCFFFAASTQLLHANGFAAFSIGARAAALAGAFTAHGDDASAIYYNPAAIAFLSGVRVKTNILFSDKTTTAFYPVTNATYESDLLYIRGAHFFTWNVSDRISFGLGFFNPYIARTQWIIENPYSYQTKFSAFYLRPVVAIKILKGLSIGIGVDFVISNLLWIHTYEWYQGIYGPYQANSRYDVKGTDVGFAAGFLWKIGNILHLGGRYQHSVDMNFSGKHLYQKVYTFPVSSVNSSMTLPAEYTVGLKLMPFHKMALCVDAHWIQWSQTKGWQFQFDRAKDDREPGFYEIWEGFLDRTIEAGNYYAKLKLKDTLSLRFGLEYKLNNRFTLRAGYSHQASAVADDAIHPIDPDLDKNIISVGFGYEGPLFSIWDRDEVRNVLSFDFYMQYVMAKAQTSTLPIYSHTYLNWSLVTFDNDYLVIGGGLGFNF